MREFKPSVALLVKNTIYGLFGGFAAGFAIYYLFSSLPVGLLIGAALGLAVLYFTLVQDNITVCVDADALTVTRIGGKMREYRRAVCRFEANMGITRGFGLGDTPCFLLIHCENEKPQRVDCTMLGKKSFVMLTEVLGLSQAAPGGTQAGGAGEQPPDAG